MANPTSTRSTGDDAAARRGGGAPRGGRRAAPSTPHDAPRGALRAAGDQLGAGLQALPRLAGQARDRATEALARRRARRDLAREAARATGTGERAEATDWARLGSFGAGLAIGALLGAGTALLLAPHSGFETRTRLVRRARRTGGELADRWDDLGDSVRDRVHQGRRSLERRVVRTRWAAEDAIEGRRRRRAEG